MHGGVRPILPPENKTLHTPPPPPPPARVDPSPDGRYLLVSWLERPWSTALPAGRFARRTQLWTRVRGVGGTGVAGVVGGGLGWLGSLLAHTATVPRICISWQYRITECGPLD